MYEALISHLRECAKYDKAENTFKEAADAIEELSKPRWIPVTERLPMRGEKAICFGKNGYMIGTYGEFGWMFPCYFGGVTHWMPLQKPPEDGTE